ncbi:unnamed protein product [Cuscuta campestris]|uniref:Uncharacterized protein n=1 Tax=Cuscuta campestris TaxID=132261 RepID=A0A484M4R4_9ASTE|nr:unnamed protein product [Cuscuta campestris]
MTTEQLQYWKLYSTALRAYTDTMTPAFVLCGTISFSVHETELRKWEIALLRTLMFMILGIAFMLAAQGSSNSPAQASSNSAAQGSADAAAQAADSGNQAEAAHAVAGIRPVKVPKPLFPRFCSFKSPVGGIEKDEKQNNLEEQLEKLLDERMKQIKSTAEKVSAFFPHMRNGESTSACFTNCIFFHGFGPSLRIDSSETVLKN